MKQDDNIAKKELQVIGQNVVIYRKNLHLTQEDLCGIADIDRSYLSEIENGKMNVTIKALVKLASALGCKLEDLILEKKK